MEPGKWLAVKDVNGYKEVHVFENERLRPLFGWGSVGHLFRIDPPPFSHECGEGDSKVNSLRDINPPVGYEWATEWKISTTHTNTDDEGWSYSSTFSRLSARWKDTRSSSTRLVHHVTRRRMWTRLARPSAHSKPVFMSPSCLHNFNTYL
jgi:hypothetical protein